MDKKQFFSFSVINVINSISMNVTLLLIHSLIWHFESLFICLCHMMVYIYIMSNFTQNHWFNFGLIMSFIFFWQFQEKLYCHSNFDLTIHLNLKHMMTLPGHTGTSTIKGYCSHSVWKNKTHDSKQCFYDNNYTSACVNVQSKVPSHQVQYMFLT